MNPPSRTSDEYSREPAAPRAFSIGRRGSTTPGSSRVFGTSGKQTWTRLLRRRPTRVSYPRGVPGLIVGTTVVGAAVLVVAEFLTLYTVQLPNQSVIVFSQRTGSHNAYAMIPIAVLAVVLAVSAVRGGGRYALSALAALALVSLLIGLVGDLPDAHSSGRLYRTHSGKLIPNASSTPQTGMYLETLGAILLIASAGLGLLFAQPVGPAGPRRTA